ncbi:GTPase-activating protein RGS2 [Kluyveromyces lactis]|uniref:KLLA0C13189p n=1 Tax=Kluyveromyces lactis (strain ATCC 8585 / CBS 2359 / DSM 70799 / NBRC 1267 / NRRL Y-1140 / WM37) TaxID=284590 RepID=Q6CTF1_KLULA|nr:uncharacterized protein KLLA0_C13189g [Kluyveromyces lactis]CAH01639.1 KLLA0C13189p [Kluyveromyces lactis]|eukprot:XP_452788.1 uncharacterized protein KLLA0_C13189g [Kluyveromyces lactis]
MLQLEELLDEELSCIHHDEILSGFHDFLAKPHCDENLWFIKATNPFMNPNSKLSFTHWNDVYRRFIQEDAPKECNFPESIRICFDEAFRKHGLPTHETIEQARLHIVNLLQDAYSKFQRNSDIPDNIKYTDCYCHKDGTLYHHSDTDKDQNTSHSHTTVLTQENIDLVSPILDKLSEFALEEEDELEEGDDEASVGERLEYQKAKSTATFRSRTRSTPPLVSTPLRPNTPPSPSAESTSSTQKSFGSSRTPQEKIQHVLPPSLTPSLPSAQRLKKSHRYSISSSSKGSTASSSSSVSSQSPTVNSSSQKFSKLVHRLKFGRSSSSSGGQSGPQSWQS